jgi:hypothetical protein
VGFVTEISQKALYIDLCQAYLMLTVWCFKKDAAYTQQKNKMKITNIRYVLAGMVMLTMLVVFSCSRDAEKEDSNLVVIHPDMTFLPKDDVERIPLKKYFEFVGYIPLKTEDDFPVGQVDRILPVLDNTAIVDLTLAKSIFIFDKDGNQIKRLSKGFGAPKEPLSIDDVCSDKNAGELYVYSGSESKIFVYSSVGEYKRIIPIPNCYFSSISKVGDDFAFYRENESLEPKDPGHNFRLCLVDSTGKFIKGWYNGVRNPNFQFANFPVVMTEGTKPGTLSFESPGLDTVLQLDTKSKSIIATAALDFGTANKAAQSKLFKVRDMHQYLNVSSGISRLGSLPIDLNGFIIGNYSLGNRLYDFLYDSQKQQTISGIGWKNDIDGIPVASLAGCTTSGGEVLYTLVDVSYLLKEKEMYRINKEKDPLMTTIKRDILSLAEKDPEVLILARLHVKKK